MSNVPSIHLPQRPQKATVHATVQYSVYLHHAPGT